MACSPWRSTPRFYGSSGEGKRLHLACVHTQVQGEGRQTDGRGRIRRRYHDSRALRTKARTEFIPILRSGDWPQASPSWVAGKYFIDLSGNHTPRARTTTLSCLHCLEPGRPLPNSARVKETNQRRIECLKIPPALVHVPVLINPPPSPNREEAFDEFHRDLVSASRRLACIRRRSTKAYPADSGSSICSGCGGPDRAGALRGLSRLMMSQ